MSDGWNASQRELEIALLRKAFLRFVQQDNSCHAYDTGNPCHSHKCGCALEMQSYIDAARADDALVGGSS